MSVAKELMPSPAASLPRLENCALSGRRVLIRVDMNVPIADGRVTNDQKIVAALATIEFVLKQGAAVTLLSHLGRPEEGVVSPELSLQPVATRLEELLSRPVRFATDYLSGIKVVPGDVVLCENVRFNVGETSDDETLARRLAELGELFVMDAFATAHRKHASTHGIVRFVKQSCAGFLFTKEVDVLTQAMCHAKRPVIAIVGGAKISTKLDVLKTLVTKIDCLIPGGGIANTLLAAQGYQVGLSLCEKAMLGQAKDLFGFAEQHACVLQLPEDVVCAKTPEDGATAVIHDISRVAEDDMILDIGPRSCEKIVQNVHRAATILWNGPLGMFEQLAFMTGTQRVAQAIADSDAYSIAGGGDTLAAIDQLHLTQDISYISTGGGAFLEFVEGKPLPAITALTEGVIQ